jgi:cytochrome c-type biogenesis protein CcmF
MTSNTTDRNNKVRFEIRDPHDKNKLLFTATPGLYYVPGAEGQANAMVWPHIQHFPFHDVYLTLNPPQTETGAQLTLKPGETQSIGGMTIKFVKIERQGDAGVAGTKFGAKLQVTMDGKTKEVLPQLELGTGGPPISHPADLDGTLQATVEGMDVASGGVTIGFNLVRPMYPVEIFHKPLTGLVWLGTGVMTIGGFISAFYRRRRPKAPEGTTVSEGEHSSEEPKVLLPV